MAIAHKNAPRGTPRPAPKKIPDRRRILDFEDLKLCLQQSSDFAGYDLSFEGDGSFSIHDADKRLCFLPPAIWQDINSYRTYLDRIDQTGEAVVCVMESQEAIEKGPRKTKLTEISKARSARSRPSEALWQRDSFEHPLVSVVALPSQYFQIKRCVKTLSAQHRYLSQLRDQAHSAQHQHDAIQYILKISRELNGVRDIDRLLHLILTKAREITSADAGSIYVLDAPGNDPKEGWLHFKITQNASKPQNLSEFKLPVNENSIVGAAVIHRCPINIEDLYHLSDDQSKNPYGAQHDRTWDQRIGYECHSMLSLPMFDISYNVVGVIQLINRKRNSQAKLQTPMDFEVQVIPFDQDTINYAEIVAQQAGIALENAMLTEEKEALFEGFVSASVTAIEQRDPTTSGHSHRVAKLTLGLADLVNRTDSGPYSQVQFNEDQFKEIEYASLLHDFGKLGVREQVLVKSKKLYPWELDLVHERWEVIRSRLEVTHLKEVVRFLQNPGSFPPGVSLEALQRQLDMRKIELQNFLEFIHQCNEPTVLEQKGFESLKDIANQNFHDSQGNCRCFLSPGELKALSVSKGSLTAEEFAEIKSHVEHTYEFLRKIPWGKKFANVPQIAAKHHEKLDGSGYPNSSLAQEIPIQSRMMSIADIFDALTASDRPYKRAVPVDRALDIIEIEVKAQKCDADLFRIFVESGCYKSVI